eukprot:scaffold14710_cov98-Isochrysis_galbana.AAC.2
MPSLAELKELQASGAPASPCSELKLQMCRIPENTPALPAERVSSRRRRRAPRGDRVDRKRGARLLRERWHRAARLRAGCTQRQQRRFGRGGLHDDPVGGGHLGLGAGRGRVASAARDAARGGCHARDEVPLQGRPEASAGLAAFAAVSAAAPSSRPAHTAIRATPP